jgi:hypothetical protein
MLNAWGEPLIKQFVQESIRHAVRLEQALAKLQAERRIVVLHYSPYPRTLKGEHPEIFAFLGSSRLEEPINRFRVNAVFHGHAHDGILEGKTSTSIPVYNVSAPRASQNRQTLSNCRAVAALYGRRQRRARYAKLSRSQRAMPPHQRGFVSVKCTGQLSTNQKPLEKTALQLSGPNGAVFAPTSFYKVSLSAA